MKKLKFPKISEKMKRRFLAGAFAVMTIFVSVMAYLTSTERTTNRFTVGDIKIDLVEPAFPGNADPTNVKTNHRTVNGDKWYVWDSNWQDASSAPPTNPTKLNSDTKYVAPDGYQIGTSPVDEGFVNASGFDKGFRVVDGSEQWYVLEGNSYNLYNADGSQAGTTTNIGDGAEHVYSFNNLAQVKNDATHFTYGNTVTFYKNVGDGQDKDISYADANYILPGEIVPKDPKIVNTGRNEAIVFMKVEVPTYTDVTGVTREVFVATRESLNNGSYKDLTDKTIEFSKLTAGNSIAANSNWIYLGKASSSDINDVNGTDSQVSQNNAHTYIFGYKTILNPEAPDDHIKDSVRYKDEGTHDASVVPYQTEELFKYVVLNPELNGVDPHDGQTFYTVQKEGNNQIKSATPVLQDIKIHAYGVQAQFLRDNTENIDTSALDSEGLTKIWTVAGFGSIVNDTIPQADGHNKYGIPNDPRDENYTNPKNPWTNANGDRIIDTSKSVETLTVTYHYGANETANVTYKRLTGATQWTGGFTFTANTLNSSYYKSSDMAEANEIVNLDTYVNSLPAGTADIWVSGEVTSITGYEVSETTKTVKFTKGGAEYSLEFTNLTSNSSNHYELTKGNGLPDPDSGKHWSTAETGGTDIGDLAALKGYLNNYTGNATTITLVQVDD